MPYGVSSGESDRLDGDLEAELSNAGFFADPYPTFARIRGRQPVAWSTTYNSWLVTRYEDVRVGLDDPRLSSDRMGALLGQLPEKSDASARVVLDHYDNMFSMAGEPQHSEDKTIVTKCFQRAQRSIDDLQASIESLVLQAVNETVRDGVVDFASSVASNIPISIIGLLLGVPESERAQLVPWTEDIFNVMASGQAIPEVVEQGARSLAAMYEYIDTLIAERVARPTDDLLGMLVSSSRGSAVFGDGRLKASIVSFFTAGHETSCAQIESSLIHLLRDNDRLEDLRAAGGLTTLDTDELLRVDPSLQRTWRLSVAPIEMSGTTIPPGQIVSLMLGAGNRDPDVFDQPDRIVWGRRSTGHLTFGSGPHFCVGARLARLEVKGVVNTLLRKFSNLELVEEGVVYSENRMFRKVSSLPVRVS